MLDRLPIEIQRELLLLNPGSSLKHINSHFYILYNDLFYDKLVAGVGSDGICVLLSVLHQIRNYIRSLDSFRRDARTIILFRLRLLTVPLRRMKSVVSASNMFLDLDQAVTNGGMPPQFNCIYVRDSWRYIYALVKNKRFHAQYSDYTIDEPTNYIYNHFVEINRTYLLSFVKSFWLLPGTYNITIGLVVKHGKGLGTTKFEVEIETDTGLGVHTFYPPTNINEILPKNQFCLLKVGEFEVPPKDQEDVASSGNQLRHVRLIMEEIGLYLKSGFRIFFIDVCEPARLFNQYELLFYTVRATDYRYFINLPLKKFYAALESAEGEHEYGSGVVGLRPTSEDDSELDIQEIADDEQEEEKKDDREYEDFMRPNDENDDGSPSEADLVEERFRLSDCDEPGFTPLDKYSNFYYNHSQLKRFFKFSTVYKHRQFVNRYGDFTVDWSDNEEHEGRPRCSYDKYGVKWKMPILGDL